MTTEYAVEAVHQSGMHFVARIGDRTFDLDYPLGNSEIGSGPRPMEMLLASLASCAGGSVAALLHRAQQPFGGLTVRARANRRSEHPTIFTDIALEFVVVGAVDYDTFARVLNQAEAVVCPIWAMLKPSTPISASFQICAE